MLVEERVVSEVVADVCSTFRQMTRRMPRPELWHPEFRQTCLFIDLETSCLDPAHRRITQLGVGFCRDGQVDRRNFIDITIQTPYDPKVWGAVYLNPAFVHRATALNIMGPELIKAIDDNCGSIMGLPQVPVEMQRDVDHLGRRLFACSADVTRITAERTMREGVPRKQAMEEILATLQGAINNQVILVGHNIYAFDLYQVLVEIRDQLGVELAFDDVLVLDTGMAVKAARCDDGLRPDETLSRFYCRIRDLRRRIRWALDAYCVEAFGLAEKYGVDTEQQHGSAAYDAWVTSCMTKELASGSCG